MKSLLLGLLLAPVALAADVSGYVYTPGGSAVEGVVVRAGGARVTTGKDGGFVLRDLAEGVVELDVGGKVKLLVLAGDLISVTLTDVEYVTSPLPAPERGEATVKGKVTLDGKPLANAPVIVGGTRVTTNAKGEYVATGLASDRPLITIDERLLPRVRAPQQATVDLALRSAPMVRGRVVDADGKPVAHARVQLGYHFDPSPARTAPGGRYALPAPADLDRRLVSVAVTPRLHSTVRSKAFLLEDTGLTVDITLPKLETVRVRVADRAGKPIAKARVTFQKAGDVVDSPIETETPLTTAEGELVLRLAPDTYHFAAAAEGFQAGSLSKTIAKAGTLDITLQREALLRGRVHRGGTGMPFVRVGIAGEDGPDATTDHEGKFELRGLAPGTYRLTISERFSSQGEHTRSIEAPGDVDLELPPTARLRGRVFDAATGAPVRDFMYTVDPLQGEPSDQHHGTSSPDGTFTVELPAGGYLITVQAEGFAFGKPVEVLIAEGEPASVELPLDRGVTLTGRVLDEGRRPLGGAQVTVADAEPEPGMRQRPRPARSATTAADGTFTLAGVEAGEARQLLVRKDGYLPHRRTLDVERAAALDVTLARGLAIQGIVMRGGKPVPGAQVEATSQALGSERQWTFSDGEGRFTLSGLVSARYTVSAGRDDELAQVRGVDPAARKEIVLSLGETPRGVIYGVVSGIPDGQPERLVVIAHSGEESAEGPVDGADRYRIEAAPVGTVWVMAVVESAGSVRTSGRKQVELAAGQELRVDFDLSASVSVHGRVTAGGQPVVASVTFMSEDRRMATARTRDDGAYEILLAAPGRYGVYARTDESRGRGFETSREIRGEETIDIDISEQVIEGNVIDAQTRQPIAGAFVAIAPPAMANIGATTETGAKGEFRIAASSGGSLRLIVSAHGYAQQVLPVDGPLPPVFEMTPAPATHIRVLDGRTGTPLDAQIAFSDDGGILTVQPRLSSDRTTYVFTVAPGRYRVLAYVKDHPIKTVEITAPGTVDIVMD